MHIQYIIYNTCIYINKVYILKYQIYLITNQNNLKAIYNFSKTDEVNTHSPPIEANTTRQLQSSPTPQAVSGSTATQRLPSKGPCLCPLRKPSLHANSGWVGQTESEIRVFSYKTGKNHAPFGQTPPRKTINK